MNCGELVEKLKTFSPAMVVLLEVGEQPTADVRQVEPLELVPEGDLNIGEQVLILKG